MEKIKYLVGDATQPEIDGNKIIVHICNDIGGWGKGFVLSISKRWKNPELKYREWFEQKENFTLGEVQFIQVEEHIWVANLIGQHKIYKDENGNAPIRYEAISKGLIKVADFAVKLNATIHMPRIGCGLAGGSWDKIEPIIQDTLISKEIGTYIYDFVKTK
ncbi:macro domain-containing protein [Flavobacterium columnare]|uniref:Macro domain-containing protein n=1 Tax=Flavobacterium columnare TaxID=996 RepID=A0AAI8G9Y3_9FLAO|nr:macro domain-containing protein [Flavobacterium columnare]AMO19118.1 macro domain-containing protein [Flavobacterium columnare]AUX17058.1 Appr-1-p processing protein [Flavobacterium columnare]QOG56063.1 macro domain-containing protein [Flavobacterium columnare]QOG58785.1 macro domain-containing protein [Flavobacterium columnare]QOG61508.1 macro domain-containing protein [Flavobacterium columnare]